MPKGIQGFQKGRRKTGGRKRGTPNQFTTLKDAFIEAFQDLGAAQGLIKWVRKNNENQRVFYSLLARMLPAEMKGNFSVDAPAPIIQVLTAVPRPGSAGDHKSAEEMTDEELGAEIRKLQDGPGKATGRKTAAPAAAGKGRKSKA